MEILLIDNVAKLGQRGDVVTVKDAMRLIRRRMHGV